MIDATPVDECLLVSGQRGPARAQRVVLCWRTAATSISTSPVSLYNARSAQAGVNQQKRSSWHTPGTVGQGLTPMFLELAPATGQALLDLSRCPTRLMQQEVERHQADSIALYLLKTGL